MKTRALCLLFAAMALAVAAAIAGCSSGGAGRATTSSESTGTVEVALSAVGPDGATYSLPPMTTILLAGSTIAARPFLDGTGPTQSFSLPQGDYQVTLEGGTDAGAFVLDRAGDGGATTVTAFLVDPQPRTVTVTTGQATPVVFHFVIPQLGDVTFANGTVVASVQVDAGAADASAAVVTGSLVFQTDVLGTNSPVTALFTPWDSPTEQVTISMAFSDAWIAALDSACVSGTATVTATPAVNSPTDDNVAAFLSEITGAGVSLCLYDGSVGGGVAMLFERTGTPQSAALQSTLGASTSALFLLHLSWQTPTPLFDGTTAFVSQLSQPLSSPAAMTAYVNVGATYPVQFSGPSAGSPLSLQVTP